MYSRLYASRRECERPQVQRTAGTCLVNILQPPASSPERWDSYYFTLMCLMCGATFAARAGPVPAKYCGFHDFITSQ